MIIREALRQSIERLQNGGVESAAAEAEWILGDLLHLSRTALILQGSDEFPAAQASRLEEIISARLDGRPLQHILGYTEFYGRRFACDARALIPRQETEILVDVVLAYLHDKHPLREGAHPLVWDLGTGSGNIAVTLAAERPDLLVLASDSVKPALGLADTNACAHGVRDRVILMNTNFFEPVTTGARFAVICSNPPYISPAQKPSLPREVRDFDPPEALYAPQEGLFFLRMIIAEAPAYLLPGGLLALEIGYDQADAMRETISANSAFENVKLTKDLAGHQRIVSAVRI